jgi:ribonucleotide reductase alpha subunit
MSPINRIQKRNGEIVVFDQSKITEAIWKSAHSVGGNDRQLAEKISGQVCTVLEVFFKDEKNLPNVEQIQDLVEKILIENGHAKTAKAYILYRQERNQLRQEKADILGQGNESKFSLEAIKILQKHFLKYHQQNKKFETPEEMFRRIAHLVAQKEKDENIFYEMMNNLEFLPSGSILRNAGESGLKLASHCEIIIPDSLEEILEVLKKTMLMYQTGGQITLDFSALRPRGDLVTKTLGNASGPLAFLKIFDTTITAVKQGCPEIDKNRAVIDIHHPDILSFLDSHEINHISNFTLAIKISPSFMEALKENKKYDLIHPQTQEVVGQLSAKSVFDLLTASSWQTAQPEIIFSSIKRSENQYFFSGTINLAKFVENQKVKEVRLIDCIRTAIHFLENCIFANKDLGGRIVLNLMGFADMLQQSGIKYHSTEAISKAEELAKILQDFSDNTVFSPRPENILSQIAETSSGLEPFSGQKVSPEQDLHLGSIFQKITPEHVYKVIHFQETSTLDELKKIYCSAYENGLKTVMVEVSLKDGPGSLITQTSLSFHQNLEEVKLPPIESKKVQEILPPPIQSNELSEEKIRTDRQQPLKKPLQKRCPKCRKETQNGDGYLLCLHCGFYAGALQNY